MNESDERYSTAEDAIFETEKAPPITLPQP